MGHIEVIIISFILGFIAGAAFAWWFENRASRALRNKVSKW